MRAGFGVRAGLWGVGGAIHLSYNQIIQQVYCSHVLKPSIPILNVTTLILYTVCDSYHCEQTRVTNRK